MLASYSFLKFHRQSVQFDTKVRIANAITNGGWCLCKQRVAESWTAAARGGRRGEAADERAQAVDHMYLDWSIGEQNGGDGAAAKPGDSVGDATGEKAPAEAEVELFGGGGGNAAPVEKFPIETAYRVALRPDLGAAVLLTGRLRRRPAEPAQPPPLQAGPRCPTFTSRPSGRW